MAASHDDGGSGGGTAGARRLRTTTPCGDCDSLRRAQATAAAPAEGSGDGSGVCGEFRRRLRRLRGFQATAASAEVFAEEFDDGRGGGGFLRWRLRRASDEATALPGGFDSSGDGSLQWEASNDGGLQRLQRWGLPAATEAAAACGGAMKDQRVLVTHCTRLKPLVGLSCSQPLVGLHTCPLKGLEVTVFGGLCLSGVSVD